MIAAVRYMYQLPYAALVRQQQELLGTFLYCNHMICKTEVKDCTYLLTIVAVTVNT